MTLLVWCVAQPSTNTETTTHPDTNTAPAVKDVAQVENWKALSIVTTFPPLYAHVAHLIDGNDTVTNLVPPGTSVHFWQPKPSDVVAMEQADIIVTNGLGLEEFLEDYLDTLETQWVVIVDTSKWIETMEFGHLDEHTEGDYQEDDEEDHDEHNEEGHDEDEHHHHEWPDPHIWLDPTNATQQVTSILQALIDQDPAQAEVYTTRAGEYINQINELDTTITNILSSEDTQAFVVFHDAYQYFLHRYELDDAQVWLVQEFHGDNPSQKEIAELIETIETENVQVIYTEPQFNPTVVQRIIQETWVIQKEIDPIGSSLEKDGYIMTMTKLAEAFSNE